MFRSVLLVLFTLPMLVWGQPTSAAKPAVLLASYITTVVNAASYAPGSSPGALTSIFGVGLAGAGQVFLNGQAVPLLYNSDNQINFLVPASTPLGVVNVSIVNGNGTTPVFPLALYSVQPGLFYDTATGYGLVMGNGTGTLTQHSPLTAGSTMQIYGTGFGSLYTTAANLLSTTTPVQATIGGVAATVLFAGAAPGFDGLDQINVEVPPGLGPGPQPLVLSVNRVRSNVVQILLR